MYIHTHTYNIKVLCPLMDKHGSLNRMILGRSLIHTLSKRYFHQDVLHCD